MKWSLMIPQMYYNMMLKIVKLCLEEEWLYMKQQILKRTNKNNQKFINNQNKIWKMYIFKTILNKMLKRIQMKF